jgi:hypothetical protein
MNETISDNLLSKIKKLLAKAASCRAIGSQAEAEAFATKAQSMLDEHKLSMSDLEFEQMKQDDPINRERINWSDFGLSMKHKRCNWLEALSHIVSKAHGCRFLVRTKTNLITFIGRKVDRQVAIYVTGTLARAIEELSNARYNSFYYEMEKAKTQWRARGFRESYIMGFIAAIAARYAARSAALKQNSPAALIRVGTHDVDVWIKEQDFKNAADINRPSTQNIHGYMRGKQDGDKANIDGVARDEQGDVAKQLGA